MSSYFQQAWDLVNETHVFEQVRDVDMGLFTNPWFMVPFVGIIGYLLFKKKWKDIVILAIFMGVWWVSGTEYMQTLTVKGELQVGKVLPVVAGGAAALGIVIYLLFGRSD
jgi:ascorbate-specific PTS system EIIC-type component UlaA